MLEKIEQKIEEDLEEFLGRRGDQIKSTKKGIHISKSLILEASNSDTLAQVSTVSIFYIQIIFVYLLNLLGHFKRQEYRNIR